MRRKYFDNKIEVVFLLFAVLVLIVVCCIKWAEIRALAVDSYEDATYTLSPSAARAYAYGDRHFNISNPSDYDIDRANHFFELAATQDPTLPYVYHQLARIAFLQGDFQKAIAEINVQISMHGDSEPSSYYVRGLIEGYMGNYTDSERDYAHYLLYDPIDWAAVNDYSWVLLKDGKPAQADAAIEKVLQYFPDNAWLFNSDAIALSALGAATSARERIAVAARSVANLTAGNWSRAYPGNDPEVASEAVIAFKKAIAENIHTIDGGAPIPAL
jgi:tetratricopeptide (TPR) repeat protein